MHLLRTMALLHRRGGGAPTYRIILGNKTYPNALDPDARPTCSDQALAANWLRGWHGNSAGR